MATLMALTLTACDEGTPPPIEPEPPPDPVGTISGTVTIDGSGAAGLTATLSSGATQTTNTSGAFTFADVVAGSYTVTISGHPDDVTFPAATQSATIASNDQTVQLNFPGQYIRSSSVVGNVVASDAMMSATDSDGQPDVLAGVTVTLTGDHAMAEPQQTDMSTGGYAFTGLRAGTYTVEISGFPEDVAFDEVSMTVEVGVGDVGKANFEGAYIRTAAVEGRVIIEGEGLAGVTVTLVGGPGNDSYTKMTGANGEYAFTELRPGDYQVSISGYDPEDYEFASNSHDVSVDLDETETVSFTGVLLRTSGISGRVSVEGMGLADIAVTLSGAADASAMTDASGQYAFAGLAAGDYTVSIAVESEAYVFGSMSTPVSVADDATAIVNFEGSHATTASVSGMLFIDELDNNDAYDEGEVPLPASGVPVALVGPGVNDQRLSATNAEGQFMFSGLRAGPYQLIVPITAEVAAELAANDVAYGGPATGYGFELGVGEARMQAVPFDITHTTINVAVTLKGGEHRGMPIPGASVTLYSDAAGETKVGSGETEASEAGVFTSIRVARAGTSDNTVHMAVSAEGYFADPTAGMQAVTWNSQSPVHPMPGADPPAVLNDADIVNLNVDVTVSGATVTTDYGGGEALAGWAIAVLSGNDPTDLTPVEGAPAMLDEDGNAAFTAVVAPDALPAAFTVAVAPDQLDAMDGGESYEGTAVTHVHTGLALAGTMDAGTIEVAYTTQTLKVYVHHELDQVEGYTGNILGGDERMSDMLELSVRYLDDSGRSRSFTKAMWDAAKNSSNKGGVYTFAHVPADADVIVSADEAVEGIKLLEPDELAAFEDMEANGVTGGAFGANGGFSHSVELCPLQATAPQDHDECASFAYVSTHNVSGLVWRTDVIKSGDDFLERSPRFVAGQSVTLSPVEGKNLAGDEETYTTAATDNTKTPLDETHQFDFGAIAAGVYDVSVPSGWRARLGGMGTEMKFNGELSPLAGAVEIDVTPATGTFFGHVTGSDGFGLDSVTVDVNGVSAETDDIGRYIVAGVSPVRGKIFVKAARGGYQAAATDSTSLTFAANTTTRHDIDLAGVQARASVSGTVRASGSNAPVAGVLVLVDGVKPTNAPTRGANAGKLLTGADGTYTAEFAAKGLGETADVSVSKAGMLFIPASLPAPAHAGSNISGFDFVGFVNATISGRVVAPGGGPMSGVFVSATPAGEDVAADTMTTSRTGTFSLNVPFGNYDIAASADDHTFSYPNGLQRVNVGPGQGVSYGAIQAMSPGARNLSASRALTADVEDTADDESDPPTYTGTINVSFTDSNGDVPDGYDDATYEVQHNGSGDFADAGATEVQDDAQVAIPGKWTFDNAPDGEFMVQVVATAVHGDGASDENPTIVVTSDAVTVGAIDPSASGVTAVRGIRDPDDTAVDTLGVSWSATANDNSEHRVVIEVDHSGIGAKVWLVAPTSIAGTTIEDRTREWVLSLPAAAEAGATDPTVGGWAYVAGGDAPDVPRADLLKALSVAVESVQGAVDPADNPWVRSDAVSVAAKPSS